MDEWVTHVCIWVSIADRPGSVLRVKVAQLFLKIQ